VLLFTGALMCTQSSIRAQDDDLSRTTLRALSSVRVIAAGSQWYPHHTVPLKQLATDIELRLRRAGLKISSSEDQLKAPGAVQLRLYVEVISKPSENYPYYLGRLEVTVSQAVQLKRDPTILTHVTTWSTGAGLGQVREEAVAKTIRERTTDLIDQFVNARLAADQ
jgi:hypothetical protein